MTSLEGCITLIRIRVNIFIGAGFSSKYYYGSGFFQMKIKLPDKDSAGVVTAFYVLINTLNFIIN